MYLGHVVYRFLNISNHFFSSSSPPFSSLFTSMSFPLPPPPFNHPSFNTKPNPMWTIYMVLGVVNATTTHLLKIYKLVISIYRCFHPTSPSVSNTHLHQHTIRILQGQELVPPQLTTSTVPLVTYSETPTEHLSSTLPPALASPPTIGGEISESTVDGSLAILEDGRKKKKEDERYYV